jgi:hypothetical protein
VTKQQRTTETPEWVTGLVGEVWEWHKLPQRMAPDVEVRPPSKTVLGYADFSRWDDHKGTGLTISLHGSADLLAKPAGRHGRDADTSFSVRNTLLHELAHTVNYIHARRPRRCKHSRKCKTRDHHNWQFKAILRDIEHEFQTGTHSRWGFAGCRHLERVPNGTPWSDEIPCPKFGSRKVSLWDQVFKAVD